MELIESIKNQLYILKGEKKIEGCLIYNYTSYFLYDLRNAVNCVTYGSQLVALCFCFTIRLTIFSTVQSG